MTTLNPASQNPAGPSQTPALVPSSSNTKRLSTINKPAGGINSHPSPGKVVPTTTTASGVNIKEVVSPGELCGFVDTLLAQLETRFDEMSEQMLSKMTEMSTRIDNLENTVQDLIQGDIDGGIGTPSPAIPSGRRG